jgi:hypothetical protein
MAASQPPPPTSTPLPSLPSTGGSSFLTTLRPHSKFKQRSHDTHHTTHIPEFNLRLALNLDLPTLSASSSPDPFASVPNTSPIHAIYLGNSHLERLKTTGQATRLGKLCIEGEAWNAGVGGDKNENVIYRLCEGLYDTLESANAQPQDDNGEAAEVKEKKCDISLIILTSGTNNLHPKHPFNSADIVDWTLLLQSCLYIAPRATILACDVFYKRGIPDRIVDEGNEMLKGVVEEVNREREESARKQVEKVKWVEARQLLKGEMFEDDRVHLNKEGYGVWDEVLWPHIIEAFGRSG